MKHHKTTSDASINQEMKTRDKPEGAASEIAKIADRCPRITVAVRAFIAVCKEHGETSPQAQKAYAKLQKLIAAEKNRASPAAMELPLTSIDAPRQCETARQELHGVVMAGGIYSRMMHELVDATWGERSGVAMEARATMIQHAGDVIRTMKPRDPLEEMLVVQALWTHARIARLNDLALDHSTESEIHVINEAADRATNTYRRLMLALAEYRRPPRTGDIITAIKQANIASQQIIQTPPAGEIEDATNEQGCPSTQDAPALPSDARRPAVPSAQRPTRQALDQVDRPDHS